MIPKRTKHISGWLKEILLEQGPDGVPKNKAIAKRMVDVALDPATSNKEFVVIASEIIDRLEGKAVTMNLNADITANPFEDVDTAKLEALKAKLQAIQNPPNEKKEESKETPPTA